MGFLATIQGKVSSQNADVLEAAPTGSTASDEESVPVNEKDHGVTVQAPVKTFSSDKQVILSTHPSGVARIEAVQQIWGKHGKWLLITGLTMMMLIFELDNSTVYNYQQYAASSFDKLSLVAALGTAQTIISAVVKPPIAKISDVIGRGETYIFTICCYVISYILCATASTFDMYAAGSVFYAIGQSGTQILDQIIISDISNMRWRGFVYGFSYTPFLVTPWISAFIVQSVVDGIGWRWGIGMFAILMPFSASFIITTLICYQGKARHLGVVTTKKTTVYEFCSLIDLGGILLLCCGFAMLLLPLTIAATTPSKWSTPWVGALIAVGAVTLIILVPYEKYVAKHPVFPVQYFKNISIILSLGLGFMDSLGFSATHTYMYSWSVIAHGYDARDATFLVYANGVVQCLIGIAAGAVMYKTREYKWLMVSGVVVRLIGYGIMIRLRGYSNTNAEIFIVQCIQGWGSGIVSTLNVVAAQIHVPHSELAQISSLVQLFSFIGSAIGSAIAGGIYTSTFKGALRNHLGAEVSVSLIDTLYNSITGSDIPAWGTPDRIAAALAYSDVMRYITIAALATSVLLLPMAWFLPSKRLGDSHNLVQEEQHSNKVRREI